MHDLASPPARPPMLVSLARSVLKILGSLLLTVAILAVLIAILLWGTVVERDYGATAAKFGIYGSWWFNALGFLLALNSTASLISRWPWKLQQMGFVLPHLGLVVLLVGCFISRRYGSEWALSVYEGQKNDLAYKSSLQKVELDGQQQFTLKVLAADGQEKSGEQKKPGEPIVVPFTSGPFNWEDFHNGALSTLPWSLAHYDYGLLYDRDGIRLEVLDYLSDSEIVPDPHGEPSAQALPFDKSEDRTRLRQANVRLTVDGKSDEFWMPCAEPDEESIPKTLLTRTVAGTGRRVELSFAPEQMHLGYTIVLHKAWRKLDAGTRQPSFYGSEIDLEPNKYAAAAYESAGMPEKQAPEYDKLLVTLNAPLDFFDPASIARPPRKDPETLGEKITGYLPASLLSAISARSYRMFQSNMSPLFNPEDVGLKTGERVYRSGFTLNYDPGRGLTYVGCLLVVAGIYVAYFVRFVKT